MIEYKNNPSDDIIEIVVEGRLAEGDFEQVTLQIEADIKKHGKLRMLKEIHSFEGVDLMVLWRDVQFGLKYINDFSHVAVVADAGWMQTIATAVDNLFSAEVKAFDQSNIEAARNWLITALDKTLQPGLKYKRTTDSSVVEIIVEGKITASDIKNVVKEMETDLAQQEKLRILEDIHTFEGIGPMALWMDLRQIDKISKISHVAIVTDAKWIKILAAAIYEFYPFKMKVYEKSQIAEARTWLTFVE